jgi:hypothetical protein
MHVLGEVAGSIYGRAGFIVGAVLNIVGVIALIIDLGWPPAVWFAIGGWLLFLSAFWELLVRVRHSHSQDVSGVIPGSTSWLLQHAMAADEMMVGPRVFHGNIVIESAIRWPDGTRGRFIVDELSPFGAADSYHLTYEPPQGPGSLVRQAKVTRNNGGHVTDRPEPVVESSI